MRVLYLLPIAVATLGCKVFDQPKRVDGLEQRVDELAEAVTKLTGEPVALRPKSAKKDAAEDEGADKKPAKGKAAKGRARQKDAADRAAADGEDGERPRTARRAHGADADAADAGDDEAKADEAKADEAGTDEAKADDAEHDTNSSAHEAADADAADAADPPAADPHVAWAYKGASGPRHWADLDPGYEACKTGAMQSPIDLAPAAGDGEESVFFMYKPTAATLVDTGHTIELDLQPGSYAIVDGARYELVQLHFHTPSEHTIDGEPAAMEMHLVHKSKAGKLAVVGVLFDEGAPSKALAPLWKAMPKAGAKATIKKFDPATLLPGDTTAYRYLGSLTTPPCTEGVRWAVLHATATDAAAKIAAIRSRWGANARPVQPLGERKVE